MGRHPSEIDVVQDGVNSPNQLSAASRLNSGTEQQLWVAVALSVVSIGAWIGLLSLGEMGMEAHGVGDAIAFEAGWLLMMTAMMLPSSLPFVLLVRRTATTRRDEATALAVTAYLGVWGVTGAAAYAVAVTVEATTMTIAFVLAGAGAYQLTPLKSWCLRRCRSPLGFFMQHWRASTRMTAFRLGALHGVHCVGCCWALMLVLVGALGMRLEWVALLAGVVLAEKVLPVGERFSRATGAVLLVAAAAVLLAPEAFGLGDSVMEMSAPSM